MTKASRYQTTSGWLNQNINRRKLIVATETLNKDQERELFHHIERSKLSEIDYLDLTQVPENKVSSPELSLVWRRSLSLKQKTLTLLRNTTSILLNPKPLYHLIDKGMGAELFASVTCDIDQKNMDCQFHCRLSEISLALMQGKTVILKGELSIYAYTAIQNLFNKQRQIKLPNSAEPQSLPGLFNYCDAEIKLSYPGCRSDFSPANLIDSAAVGTIPKYPIHI